MGCRNLELLQLNRALNSPSYGTKTVLRHHFGYTDKTAQNPVIFDKIKDTFFPIFHFTLTTKFLTAITYSNICIASPSDFL